MMVNKSVQRVVAVAAGAVMLVMGWWGVSAPAAPQASGGGAGALTVGHPTGTAVVGPLFVAQEEGFFAKNGLIVSLVRVQATASMAALGSGELQVAFVGGQDLVNANLSGASNVMVAVSSDYPVFSLYVQRGITRVQDLAGKTIGVTVAGSSSETTAKLFLTHFGLLGQVQIVHTGANVLAELAALERGIVASAVISPPSTVKAANAGFVELINGIRLGVPFTHDGMIVARTYLKEHRDVVERFLRAYRDAWTFTAAPANESAVLKVLASYTKVSPEMARGGYDYILPIWSGKKIPTVDPRGIANALRFSPNPKAKDARPDDFFDNSIIESLR